MRARGVDRESEDCTSDPAPTSDHELFRMEARTCHGGRRRQPCLLLEFLPKRLVGTARPKTNFALSTSVTWGPEASQERLFPCSKQVIDLSAQRLRIYGFGNISVEPRFQCLFAITLHRVRRKCDHTDGR